MKILIVVSLLSSVALADNFSDMQAAHAQHETAYQTSRVADALEVQNQQVKTPKPYQWDSAPPPVVINEAGPGCRFQPWNNPNGTPKWAVEDQSREMHQVYVKVCVNDPYERADH